MPDESSQLTPEQTRLFNSQQFAAKIRAKYPGAYDDIADDDLTRRVVAKYPEYRDSVKVPLTQQEAGGEIAKATSLPSLGLSEPAPLKPLVPQPPPPRTPGEGAFVDSAIQSGKVLGPFQKPTPQQQAQHSMDLLAEPAKTTPHPFEPTPAALPSETPMPLSGPEQANIVPQEVSDLGQMTGFKVPREEVRDAPVNAYMEYGPKSVVRGIKTWAHGEMQPGDSGEDERAKGLAEALQGVGVTLLPSVPVALADAPLATLAGAGSGMVLGPAAKKAALAAGASPSEAALAEQIGYWSPGLMATLGRMALKPRTLSMEAPGAWGKAVGVLPKESPEAQIDPQAFADAKVAAHQKLNDALEATRARLHQQIENDPTLKGNAEAQAQAKAHADEQLSEYGDQQHAKIEAQRAPPSKPPQYRAVAMVGKTPDEYVAGIKAGDHEFTVRISRPQPPEPNPEAGPNVAELPSGAPATQQGSGAESTAAPSSPTPSLLHTSEHPDLVAQKPRNMLTVKEQKPTPAAEPPANPFKPGFYQRAVGVTAVKGGRVGIADLQKELGIQPNTATRVLEQLKNDGYVAGTPNFKGGAFQGGAPVAANKPPVPKFLRPGAGALAGAVAGEYGDNVEVKTPSSSIPGRYKIVEADSLVPSHDAETFAPNPAYPAGVQERTYHTSPEAQNRVIQQTQNYDPDYTVNTNPDAVNGPPVITPQGLVLGGNSRAMATQRIYTRNQGDAYRDLLKQRAQQFGIDPAKVDQFQSPVLVREIGTPASAEDARRLGSELNKSMTGALGVSEKAVSAGKSITPETLRSISQMIDNLGGDASLREVMAEHGDSILEMLNKDGVITDRERPQFVDTSTGGLSDEGKKFVERALRGVLVDDPVLMDSVPKSILQKLDSSLADIISVGQRKDAYDIMPVIREALAEHAQIVKRGTNAETYFGHKPMFGEWSPMVEAVGRKLAEKQSDVRAAMRSFARDAAYDTPHQGMLMMGEAPTPVAAFNHAFGTNLSDAEYEKALKSSAEQYGRERAGRKVAPVAPTEQTEEPVTPVETSIPEPPPGPHQATAEAPKAEQPASAMKVYALKKGVGAWDKGYRIIDEDGNTVARAAKKDEAEEKLAWVRSGKPMSQFPRKPVAPKKAEESQPEAEAPKPVEHTKFTDFPRPKPQPASEPAPPSEPTLSAYLLHKVAMGEMPKDNLALKKLVEGFDGKPADPARMKQAQEAMEVALVQQARHVVEKGQDARATFDDLVKLYESQPSLNIRTSTSIENQAYSTPAPLAFLADKLAGVDQNATVYEPAAGNGMLLIGADPRNVIANELDPARVEGLKEQGFRPMQGDALEADVTPKSVDAVLTNPPFGSVKDENGVATKVRVDGYKVGQIDHLIAARALDAIKDNGRACLILGANRFTSGGQTEDDRIFFNWLYSHYSVTGHFELDGKLYGRQGAAWPVRVVSIGGRKASSAIAPPEGSIPRVKTWSEVYDQFDKSMAAQPPDSGVGGSDGSLFGEPANDSQPVRVDSGRPTPRVDRQGPQAGEGVSHGRPGGNAEPVRDRDGRQPEGMASADSSVRPDADVARSDKLARGENPTPQPERVAEPGRNPQQSSAIIPSENVLQVPYKPASAKKDVNVLIPVNMKQPLEQAMLALEDAVGDLDQFVRKELGYESLDEVHDHFMGLQVDSVAAAIHQIKKGKAVVIADQTGIGKGRQAAAVIRWAVKQGRVPVFMTKDANLFTDMYGDLADIGTHDINPFIVNSDKSVKLPDGREVFTNSPSRHHKTLESIRDTQKLPYGRNAVFCTYSQINVPNTQQEMLQRLAPKSIFVLDESHNAGGDSNTGEFLRNVLNEAAGVTYLSATYAKRPDNMPLYFKTDMGEAISDDGSLVSAMVQGGLPLQTVVSNNLVKAGQMFRRERSFDGISMVTKVDTAHRAQHVKLADATTEALRAIVDADRAFHDTFVASAQEEARKENKANKISGAGNQANKTVSHAEFSSVVHNFVRQMLLGIKADTAAQDAIAAIERGEKPLVALDNTMGSFLKAYAEEHGLRHGAALEDFDWRSVLSRALDRSRYIKIKDAQGNETKQYVPVDELDDTTSKFYQTAQKLIDKLKIDTPVSPIDWIRHRLEEAGYTVAELTGRELAVDYSDPANPKLAQVPVQEKRDRVETIRKFNDGRLHSLILNVSGSTGISAHASEKFADQRPRHMIVAQPAQDINVFMQMLGRINRTGQVRLPIYTILNADLPAEKRPTALLAKKMKSLNANTSSNTDSATSVKTVDMLNKYGDQIVANYLTDNPDLAGRLGIDDDELGHGGAPAEGLARKATGRLAILPVKVQEEFYNDVEHQYQAYIDYLDATNQNELEPKTFDYDAQELQSDVLAEATNPNSPFGESAIYGEYSIKAQKPLTADEVTKSIEINLGGKTSTEHAKALVQDLDDQFAAYRASMAPDSPMLPHSAVVADTGRRFIYDHKIGDTYRVEINGDTYSAAIVNVRSTHKGAGNPYALSKINVVLATRGPLRNVSVPATQFDHIEVSALYEKPEGIFRHSAAEVRDTAKIVTGNLLSAYGELKETCGTIINFTKHDGTTEQGILLPKKFDFKQHTRGDYRLRTPEHALKFLRKSVNPRIEDMGIASRDGNVKVVNHHGKLQVITPKAKARGGKYFLDHAITDLTGDFVSQGPTMRADLPKGKEAQVLDQIMRKSALYAAPSMAEEAKGMAPKEATLKAAPKASVKMMVTKDDEARLRAMGYPQTDIDKMSPQEAAKALGEDGDDSGDSGDTDASSGTVLRSSVFGLDIAAEKVYHLAKRVDGAYQRFIDKGLQGARLGRAFPEVEAIDPEVGRDLRVLAAAPQYIRARAEHIVDKCTGDMTREQEEGFWFLADKQMRDWLAETHSDECDKHMSDPRIQKALRDFKPYDEELTEARQALGGNVTEGSHMKWIYEKYVGGINKKHGAGEGRATMPYDNIVTPQKTDKYGRTTTPEYAYEHALHEFGPSFVPKYVSTMLKLAEHKAAMDFLTKATKVGSGDMLPDSIEYEGQTFFRPDVAQDVRRSVADSPKGKEIAESLGVDQLPKPSEVREYAVYDPNPPRSGEVVSKALADQVLDAVKTGNTDLDALAGLAYTVKTSHSLGLYLGPKAIVEEFQRGAQHAIPDWLKAVGSVLNPISGMIRRQVIGLGMGVPHIKNILRRTILHSPGAHLNPVGYINATKALFSRELKLEAIAGIDTPAFDELLKHAGMSDHGIEAYKTYLRSNLDAPAWARAWRLMKATGADWKEFEKNLLAEIKAAERQGGFLGHARAVTTAVGGAIETPFRPLNFIGHHLIFGPGGFDQRARLLLYKLIKAECPGITPDQMAQQINMELGRYNKASWTTLQQDLQAAGVMFFPGWNYSSTEYCLRHPLKGRLPLALLMLLANQVIHHYRKNKKDSTDLGRVHYGRYTISDNLFRERLAEAEMGMPLRAASSLLQGHGAERALRDAVLGVPSDARAFVGMVNPLALAPVEVTMGKELYSGRDIVPAGDRKHKWGPEKDWTGYGLRKFLPVYSEVAAPEEKENLASFLLRNTGTNTSQQGKPKGSSGRPLFLGGGK